MVDHLSRLVNEKVTQEDQEIQDGFPDESLLSMSERPWFIDIANYKVFSITCWTSGLNNLRGG